MPAPQTEQENCVAHNGSLIPVPGRDIMVQAWYQGGVSVFDFTDAAKPVEIAFFDRGPIDAQAADHGRVLVDLLVQRLHLRHRDRPRRRRLQADAERVSCRRTRSTPRRSVQVDRVQCAAAAEGHLAGDSSVVARAYLDQLTRTQGHSAAAGGGRHRRARERRPDPLGSRQWRGRCAGPARRAGHRAGRRCRQGERPRRRPLAIAAPARSKGAPRGCADTRAASCAITT